MYAMVDCNSFYCSCERLFDPTLATRPVIVLSNNDGCAVSRTDEAKALGIEMGTPEFMIYDTIRKHRVAVFSSNYTLYNDISERVMQTMGSFVPGMEVYSIDEAFLDMHDLPYHDLLQLGMNIRRTVWQHVGIPVCVGIACTKTLAKMANRYAKKRHQDVGVFYAANAALVNEMLSNTVVQEIWGIGKQHGEFLRKNGFHTAAQLAAAPDSWVRKHLSVVGLRLVHELRGIATHEWEFEPPPKKNICTSRSFGELTANEAILGEAIANHAASCARKLRSQGSAAKEVHVLLQTNPHRVHDRQYARTVTVPLPSARNDSASIIKAALQGLSMIYHPGFNYKKCGVTVKTLVPEQNIQPALFENRNAEKMNAIMHTVDSINKLKGVDTVRMATQVGDKKYRLRANHLSKRYTTNIRELPEIND